MPPEYSPESIDPFSRAVVRLTMFYNDVALGTGTGIIVQRSNPFLVTAWHNLAGRDPATGRELDRDLVRPNYVEYLGFATRGRIDLYDGTNDPFGDNARYHTIGPAPDGGITNIDVTAIALRVNPHTVSCTLDDSYLHQNEVIDIHVAQTCYIIGYPEGLVHWPEPGVPLPIWKTGHIASEPHVDWAGFPKLLIDASTRRGMSGSPVFLRDQYRRSRLVGIYVGRYKEPLGHSSPADERSPHFTTELGWVFKQRVILELLAKDSKGG